MQLMKGEFQDLWNIENSWQSDPKKASNGSVTSLKKHEKIFLKLNKLGFIKIEIRDNEIYGGLLLNWEEKF